MKKSLTLLFIGLLYSVCANAQFASIQPVDYVTIESGGTQDKAQSKVFEMDGKQWAVFPTSTGTNLFRLDGTSWTSIIRLTSRKGRVDCKVVGNVVHVFVYQKTISQLISVEYVPATASFKPWSARPAIIDFPFNEAIKTGTIDVDGQNRMWLAYVRNAGVHVQWSDAPYSTWSTPIAIATGIRDDDGAAIIAMPGKIGVLWSNQVTRRWGFKTHLDGANPTSWSGDEVPASQSALNVGYGMADNHMNLKAAQDGTLYCAVKTSYNNENYPLIALLVRRPSGTWDNLYDVSHIGTTPVVVLNENTGKLRVIYSTITYGGDIQYNESPLNTINFGPKQTLRTGGALRDPSASKQNQGKEALVIFTDANKVAATGTLVQDVSNQVPVPDAPALVAPANNTQSAGLAQTLTWQSAANASSYFLQLSTNANFTTTVYSENVGGATSQQVSGLANSTTYYWRVQAVNATGGSAWSSSWSFTTVAPTADTPGTPVLQSPTHQSTDVALNPTLSWQASQHALSYQVQVATNSSFSNLVRNQTVSGGTSFALTGLNHSTSYYWRVMAMNAEKSSDWSATWQFTTLSAPTSPGAQLVGHWKMDEGGGDMLVDASGLANHADLLNPSNINWTNGMDGLALNLPGTLKRYGLVAHHPSLNITDAITISAWIRPATTKSRVVLSKVEPDGYHLGTNGKNKLEFWFNYESNGSTYRIYSTSNVPSNGKVWVHVAATFDGRTSKIYINGIEDNSETYPATVKIGPNNSPLLIGSLLGNNRWDGGLDDVRLYSGTLTADEVRVLANMTTASARHSALAQSTEELSEEERNLMVYPNPLQGEGLISFSLPQSDQYTIQLYDNKGAMIKLIAEGYAEKGAANSAKLDASGLNRGLYLIRLETKSGVSRSFKVVFEK